MPPSRDLEEGAGAAEAAIIVDPDKNDDNESQASPALTGGGDSAIHSLTQRLRFLLGVITHHLSDCSVGSHGGGCTNLVAFLLDNTVSLVFP